MSKNSIIFLVVLVLAIGVFIFNSKKVSITSKSPKQEITKNIDILESQRNLEITSESVAYFPNATGYYARPKDGATYPGIVMVHENRGLRPETKQAAEQLAKEGYMVFAVDLFGATAEDQTQAKALTANFKQETGVANMRAAVAYLREKGATKVASLGWCFGGKQSVELAISGEKLDATIVYYGGNMATTTDKLNPITWPVLGVFGDKDQVIPLEMVDTFKSSLKTLGIKNEIYVYPGVGHAFANPSGMNYAPQETKDSWAKTLAFLKKNLQ